MKRTPLKRAIVALVATAAIGSATAGSAAAANATPTPTPAKVVVVKIDDTPPAMAASSGIRW